MAQRQCGDRKHVAGSPLWLLAQLALAMVLLQQQAGADQAAYLQSITPSVIRFVNELPLSDADVSFAAEAISKLSVVQQQAGLRTTPPPAGGVVSIGVNESNLHVLHQIGHHVTYALLPERLRGLYWHPSQCADLMEATALQDAGPTRAYDDFSEAAAYFFVITFASFQRAGGEAVEPGVAALMERLTSPDYATVRSTSSVMRQLAALCRLYGELLISDPPRVYADFFQTVLAHSRRSAALPLPARTMQQWLLARQLYGGLPGTTLAASVTEIAAQFTHDQDTGPHLLTYDPAATLAVSVNGLPADGSRSMSVNVGDRLRTDESLSLLKLARPTAALLGPGLSCELRRPAELHVEKGQLLVEGPAVISTPTCTFHLAAASVAVRVNLAGETTIGVISGNIHLQRQHAQVVDMAAGETVTVMADRRLLGPGRAAPMQVAFALPLGGAYVATGPPVAAEIPDLASTQIPTAEPPIIVSSSEQQQEAAAAPASGTWQVHAPDLLPEIVLCRGVDGKNRPYGVAASFPSDIRRICLYVGLDFGTVARQLRVRWRRGPKTLSGRIIRAKGKRQILNTLTCGAEGSFAPGEYEVTVSIDERPGATLRFTVGEQ